MTERKRLALEPMERDPRPWGQSTWKTEKHEGLLKEHYARSLERQRCDLTVEIHPMRKDSYFKVSSAGN